MTTGDFTPETKAFAVGFVHERLIGQRTELCNQLQGLASEYGVYFPPSRSGLIAQATAVIEGSGAALSPVARGALTEVLNELRAVDQRVIKTVRQIAELGGAQVVGAQAGIAQAVEHRAARVSVSRRDEAKTCLCSLMLMWCQHAAGGSRQIRGSVDACPYWRGCLSSLV